METKPDSSPPTSSPAPAPAPQAQKPEQKTPPGQVKKQPVVLTLPAQRVGTTDRFTVFISSGLTCDILEALIPHGFNQQFVDVRTFLTRDYKTSCIDQGIQEDEFRPDETLVRFDNRTFKVADVITFRVSR